MTAAELREKLAALLASDLGKYSNGLPSVWVFGSAQDPPSASDGLECLIQQMPLNPAQGSSGGQRYKPQQWVIVLKNFKKSSNLVNAVRKIETNFIVERYSHIPFTATVFEQARIIIFDPITINI